MVKLAECIVKIITNEYGVRGFLNRLSDPWFFQSLSCVLGYDWHSSGTTTVTCGALKEAIKPEDLGFAVAGGKGRNSLKTPVEIEKLGMKFGLTQKRIDSLKYASKMAAKVDNSMIQDGYKLYHHTFFFGEKGEWMVIQQGLNEVKRNARRYHWPLEIEDFIEEPQNAIICQSRLSDVLDMTSSKSRNNRKICVDIVREQPRLLRKMAHESLPPHQSSIDHWIPTKKTSNQLVMPHTINWKAIKRAYEFQPRHYEELISVKGIGPSTIRGLSLIAELIYGEKPSWRDPVRFSFAFGGKDGIPFPIDKRAMDDAIDVLRNGITSSPLKREQRLRALKRLRRCAPKIRRQAPK